jgi:hypothetical protein
MKWTSIAATASLSLLASLSIATATAAPRSNTATARALQERSPDVLTARKATRAATVTSAPSALAAAAALPPVEDVLDVDSFGRNVTYLGLAQTKGVQLLDDCTGVDPAETVCITRPPGDGFYLFNETGLGTYKLPGKSTKSLLCFNITPFLTINYHNESAAPRLASFGGFTTMTIANPVLDDPALLDPATGLPFNGVIESGLNVYRETFTLAAGAMDQKRMAVSRGCNAGFISKRSLMDDYGLSETLANKFFRQPITITFGLTGSVRSADLMLLTTGVRFYGD